MLPFPDLFDQMDPLEFDNLELDAPISVNRKGDIVTVRELIAEKGSDEIKAAFRAAFGDACIPAPPKSAVLPVGELDQAAQKRVAIAAVQKEDLSGRVVSTPDGGTYKRQQLIREIRKDGSTMGAKIVRGVMLNGGLTQHAIERGKVRPRITPRGTIAIPAFDF